MSLQPYSVIFPQKDEPVMALQLDRKTGKILEKRRNFWLDRLILNTLWLKSSKKSPLPWHQMFHLAEAVADTTFPLSEIPLMESIAIQSLGAYLGRREDEGL